MTVRHNQCQNPALSVDNTGWGGESTPDRVTGLPGGEDGFPVVTGARYNAGSFIRTQLGACSPAVEYTLSAYLRPSLFPADGNIYIEWTDSGGGHAYPSAAYSAPLGQATRISITATAPADTVSAAIIVDGVNYATNPCDISAVLIEAAPTPPAAYFDGDSANSSWDGTAGLSSSTFDDTAPEGAPGLDWAAGPPQIRWAAAGPDTAWAADPASTRWEVGRLDA